MANLRGKTLFITGASRGIGLAIALRAARDGANVAIAAKTTEPHTKLPGTVYTAAEEIEKAGGKIYRIERRDQCGFGRHGSVQLHGVNEIRWALLNSINIVRVKKL